MLVIEKTDVLIINEEEACQLSSKDDIEEAAFFIKNLGPQFLIIKKGEDGALLYNQNQSFYCPSFQVEKCIDPTGAGDTFAGAFIGHIAHTKSLSFNNMKKAVIKACAMASFCVEDFGIGNLSNKDMSEIENRITILNTKIN
jgi:sugar/nucleoside kinase (ribokinase family)